jgi:hypothetical protein
VVTAGYFLFLQRHTDGSAKYALAACVAVMAVQTMAARILVGAMLGEGTNIVQIALTGLLPQALTTIVIGGAYAFGLRWNAVEVTVLTIALVGGVLIARLRVLASPTGRQEDAIDGPELHALARRTHIGSVGPIDGLTLDRTLVGSLMGTVQLGLYSAAFALSGLTTILGGSLASVILPRVARAQAEPEIEGRLVRKWLLASAALIAVVVCVLVVLAERIIRLAFGTEFLPSVACARWLIVASGLLDFRRVLIAILQGRGRGGRASVIELALTPFVIAGIAIAAQHDSLVGVAVTLLVVGAVACVILGIAVTGSRPRSGYAPRHRQSSAAVSPTVFASGEAVALDRRGTLRLRPATG